MQLYGWALEELEPGRELFLAVSDEVYNRLFQQSVFKRAVRHNKINLIVFDVSQEVILQWIKQ